MGSLDWVDIPNSSVFYQWYMGVYTGIASVSPPFSPLFCCTLLCLRSPEWGGF